MHQSLHSNGEQHSDTELEPTRQELSARADTSLAGADNPMLPATQTVDNSHSTNTSATEKGVSPPEAENSNRHDGPVRTRAPSIRYEDARCNQALGPLHFDAKDKNDSGGAFNTHLHNNKRTDQVRGQAKSADFEQTTLLTKAMGSLVN